MGFLFYQELNAKDTGFFGFNTNLTRWMEGVTRRVLLIITGSDGNSDSCSGGVLIYNKDGSGGDENERGFCIYISTRENERV